MTILMRSFDGKSILSLIRNGNYAHAGEEEAIIRVFKNIGKDASKNILDVGCGKGGTAKFVHDHGWGKVTGIDIEQASIEYSQKKYPEIDFYCTDVINADKIVTEKFDLIYLFNSFYEFPDQEEALKSLRKLAHNDTTLIIFDYIDLSSGSSSLIIRNDRTKITNPVGLSTFDNIALKTGWSKESYEDLSNEYRMWYQALLEKIEHSKEKIISDFGEAGYRSAQKRYTSLLNAITDGEITGGIIKAKVVPAI